MYAEEGFFCRCTLKQKAKVQVILKNVLLKHCRKHIWCGFLRYEGDWIDGIRQGKGCYTSKSSGNKYDGEYNNDKKEGSGKYIWSNGDWYDGAWSGGLRHGQGVYVWKEKNEK